MLCHCPDIIILKIIPSTLCLHICACACRLQATFEEITAAVKEHPEVGMSQDDDIVVAMAERFKGMHAIDTGLLTARPPANAADKCSDATGLRGRDSNPLACDAMMPVFIEHIVCLLKR